MTDTIEWRPPATRPARTPRELTEARRQLDEARRHTRRAMFGLAIAGAGGAATIGALIQAVG